MLFGQRVRVVYTAPQFWTELTDDGRLVHHAGKLVEKPTPGKWLDVPKPCSVCKQPCQTTTPRGRAVHDSCEGWTNVLTDELNAQVIFEVAAALNAQVGPSTDTTYAPKEIRRDRAA